MTSGNPSGEIAAPFAAAQPRHDAYTVLARLAHWLEQGEPCWLITVLSTWGSAPRPAGTLLVWSRAGHCGSLSGGCIEEDLLAQLANGDWPTQSPYQINYGISAEQAYRLRLPCGGQMTLLLEQLMPSPALCQQVNGLVQALARREPALRTVNLDTGAWHWQRVAHTPPHTLRCTPHQVAHFLGPRYRLLIIGANQIAEHLVQIGQLLNMECRVCDPRPDAFAHWPHPAASCTASLPDDWLIATGCDAYTAIITLAHDPRVDDMALMQALLEPAYYVGALGSQRTAAKRRERLRQLGLNDAQINRLQAPVGLPIGSRTPAEIAVAISADLIAHQRAAERSAAALHAQHSVAPAED